MEVWEMYGYKSENDYLHSLKQEDHYHFSFPFEYIEKNYGNGVYDIATTNMEIDVDWSDAELGYVITYRVPEMYLIDPEQGNSGADEFYEYAVEERLLDELESMGIGSFIVVSFARQG